MAKLTSKPRGALTPAAFALPPVRTTKAKIDAKANAKLGKKK